MGIRDRTEMSDVRQVQGRWFPYTVLYKDMLKQGKGTEFKVTAIRFNEKIQDYIFTKAALKQETAFYPPCRSI